MNPDPRLDPGSTSIVGEYRDSRPRRELYKRCYPGHTTGREPPRQDTVWHRARSGVAVHQPFSPRSTRLLNPRSTPDPVATVKALWAHAFLTRRLHRQPIIRRRRRPGAAFGLDAENCAPGTAT